jgi:hypothetical protein
MGVAVFAVDGFAVELGGPEVARRLSPAKSATASRSCLSQAQRKLTERLLPEARARQSPISARSRAGSSSRICASGATMCFLIVFRVALLRVDPGRT